MTTKDMACHTWALSGNTTNGVGASINKTYTSLMNKIGDYYSYGNDLQGKSLIEVRKETMEKIALISETRKKSLGNNVFLCGGFREGQVCPEHLWLEDHTTNKTYDTFINQDVRVKNAVGLPGQAFQPPCEASAFNANQIVRVKKNGYTDLQYTSLP